MTGEARKKTNGLALYHYAGCPFCSRVRSATDCMAVELELRDILQERVYRDELVEATGRETVPCLRIREPDGAERWLHESADIIAYLEQRFCP